MVLRRSRSDDELERAAEAVLEDMGFELVQLEWTGGRGRPLFRLRIDRSGSSGPGQGVTVEDCARVSRELEAVLDERQDVPERYVLEVSSPGVERPLRRRRDFERSVGSEISVRGYGPLPTGAKRIEGVLLGVEGVEGSERLRMRLSGDEEVEVPLEAIARANLVFRWDS